MNKKLDVKKKQDLIIEKLLNKGFKVESVSYTGRCEIIAIKKYAKVSITTEGCLCHGGRLWIDDLHTNQGYELSHATYDEDKGIVDADSELEYIIKNELEHYLDLYSTFVYKLVKINQYAKAPNGLDKEDVSYHANLKSASNQLHSQINDLISLDEFKGTFPNENIYENIKRIEKPIKYSWENGRIWVKVSRFQRKDKYKDFELDSEYEAYLEIFKK